MKILCLIVVSAVITTSLSVNAMRSGPFWENDAEVDKDKWSVYDLRGKKRKDKARTALMDAVVNNQKDIVELLIEKGADINAAEKGGWTSLHWAIHYNREDIARLLIEKGADVNAKTSDGYGRTPLSIALKENMIEISKLLINKGADLKPETEEGISVLSVAIRDKQTELAKLMIDKNVFIMGCPRSKVFPMVIAHRGNSAHYPENTLPAFEAAIKDGAVMIELDVQLSKDKEIVVMHDSTLERTTDGSGLVSDLTLEELKKLDAGSWFNSKFKETRIPTLQDVFEAIGDKALINIEIKPDIGIDDDFSFEKKLVGLIKDYKKMNQVIVSSFNYQILRNIRNISKKVNIAVLSEVNEKNINIIDLINALQAISYNPETKFVTKDMVEKLHKAGILIMPWCDDEENNKEMMDKMKALKVDGFYANDPVMLKSVFSGSNVNREKRNNKQ